MIEQKFESARIAAEWWANALKGRAEQDAGLDDVGGGMGAVLLLFASLINRPKNENIDEFQTKLETALNEQLAADRNVVLSVDYSAEGLLAEIACQCGINYGTGSSFPVKTVMWVNQNSTIVSNGYRAANQTLYSSETKKEETKPTNNNSAKKSKINTTYSVEECEPNI